MNINTYTGIWNMLSSGRIHNFQIKINNEQNKIKSEFENIIY